jgi:hypothetical protein
MSNPIVLTTAAFATANMKPIPDEQIDALWGQNIADNTGFLYNRLYTDKVPGPCFGCTPIYSGITDGTYRGTFFFEKRPGMGTFFGSFVGTVLAGAAPTYDIYMNGTNIFSKSNTGTLYSLTIGTDLVGISDGAMVPVSWTLKAPSTSNPQFFSFTGWQKP